MRLISGLKRSCVVLVAAVSTPAMAQAPQSPNFNRTTTVRRELTAGPARGGQGTRTVAPMTPSRGTADDPLRPYSMRTPGPAASTRSQSSSAQAELREPRPISVQVRSTPHAFYPGMRSGQGRNLNAVSPNRRTMSRTGLPMMPGMMMPGGGMMMPGGMSGPAPLASPTGR